MEPSTSNMKKFFAKLVNWQAQRGNNAERIHEADQQDQARLSRERQEQIMHNRGERKYVSERTVPTEQEIEGPSEPEKA